MALFARADTGSFVLGAMVETNKPSPDTIHWLSQSQSKHSF